MIDFVSILNQLKMWAEFEWLMTLPLSKYNVDLWSNFVWMSFLLRVDLKSMIDLVYQAFFAEKDASWGPAVGGGGKRFHYWLHQNFWKCVLLSSYSSYFNILLIAITFEGRLPAVLISRINYILSNNIKTSLTWMKLVLFHLLRIISSF